MYMYSTSAYTEHARTIPVHVYPTKQDGSVAVFVPQLSETFVSSGGKGLSSLHLIENIMYISPNWSRMRDQSNEKWVILYCNDVGMHIVSSIS